MSKRIHHHRRPMILLLLLRKDDSEEKEKKNYDCFQLLSLVTIVIIINFCYICLLYCDINDDDDD